MDMISYFDKLYNRYLIYYSTSKNINALDNNIEIMAEFNDKHGRTFLSPKDVIDSYEINEICFVKIIENLNDEGFNDFTNFLKRAIDYYVQPKEGHMCTYITGVIITLDQLDDKINRMTQKFKYGKSYFFTLRGWCDIRLLVINPEKELIVTNKLGRKVIKFYDFE